MNIAVIVAEIDAEIAKLQKARNALMGTTSRNSYGRRGPRKLSAAARARISAAQKARWAKIKRKS